jgi:glycine/D-amino acid oxidase-like deaminating enzyme
MDPGARYRRYSFWLDTCEDDLAPRDPLPGDLQVDVAIAGAGFSGLWTAYYLAKGDPTLRIAVLEKEIAGFGASGRNGGWCTATFSVPGAVVAESHGRDAALATQRAMFDAVDEVGRVCATESIDAHYVKGGTVLVAMTPPQAERLRATVAEARAWGWSEEDWVWLEPAEVRARIDAKRCLGGAYTPHCAALHPARLARGLARAVEGLGVRIFEGTTVTAIERGRVVTDRGVVRCDVAVRALEGYSSELPGSHRLLLPLHIFMTATEPLPASFWEEVGWRERETLGDPSYSYLYAQRTADDRIALGGRAARYPFGSNVRDVPGGHASTTEELLGLLRSMFPAIGGVRATHEWGGYVGIARDWWGSVGLDPARGLAWVGGLVGDGVSESNLGGRTVADLVLSHDTERTRLPWVGHRWRTWEPEPLRWLGIRASMGLMLHADRVEARTGRSSRLTGLGLRLMGLSG